MCHGKQTTWVNHCCNNESFILRSGDGSWAELDDPSIELEEDNFTDNSYPLISL